jgi:hypothetical protein
LLGHDDRVTTDEPNAREPRDPPWTRDELILMCAALAQNDWKQIRATDPRAIELAQILKSLPIHPVAVRTSNSEARPASGAREPTSSP